jgi:hypothetical protein
VGSKQFLKRQGSGAGPNLNYLHSGTAQGPGEFPYRMTCCQYIIHDGYMPRGKSAPERKGTAHVAFTLLAR